MSPEQLLNDVIVQTPHQSARADGIAIGIFEGIDDATGSILVNIPTFGLTRIPARSVNSLVASQVGQTLALGFEAGDPMRPIVLGVILGSPSLPTPVPTEALIDGERVIIQAENEIELRCGNAAIILSADGRIQLRGTYIPGQASATQRILGGSVNIN